MFTNWMRDQSVWEVPNQGHHAEIGARQARTVERVTPYADPIRDDYVWEKLNSGRQTQIWARNCDMVQRQMPPRNEETARLAHGLLLAAAAAVPIAMMLLLVLTATASH